LLFKKKFYRYKLETKQSVVTYMSNCQRIARQLTDLGEKITERQILSKIKCGLPDDYDSFLLAWDSVPFAEQTLHSFQTRVVKREEDLKSK
jgi:hypothetical protein